MRGIAGIVAGVILFILAVPCLLLAGWGLVFNVPTVSIVAFTAAWILFPLFNRFKAIQLLKFGVSFVLIPATLALSPLMISEVDRQVEALSGKNRHDMSAFDLRDRVTLLMMLEPGPSARRVFDSEFGLGSRKLRERLTEFAAGLASDDTASSRSFGPVRIEWSKTDYRLTEPEARYALALNQTTLTAKAERRGNRWLIDVRHEMEVRYPDSSLVTLVSRPRLRMEEGLFWVLQNYGWLHPYTAEWRFQVYSDDKRLK